jgi:hypothetical protein
MLAQLKYSSRINLDQRVFTLIGTVIVNLAFYILGAAGVLPMGWMVVGEVFSSISLTALVVVIIIADVQAVSSLFSPPGGYIDALTPVRGWKIILGRIIPMVILDLISLAIGIVGVVLQASLLTDMGSVEGIGVRSEDMFSVILVVIGYFMLLLLIVFACAFAKSVLFPLAGRGVLGAAAAIVVVYLFSWLDMILAPFAQISRFGMFFSVEFISGWNAGTIAYLILTLVKAAILLIVSSYLYERKVNL